MTNNSEFELEVINRVNSYSNDKPLQKAISIVDHEFTRVKYSYNFSWLGRPIFQNPSDLLVFQEIIWEYKPDLIIETGIARGGSLIFYASMMTLLEACNEIRDGHVIGIDVDIREHNKKSIIKHPLSNKITMFEGSSTDIEIIEKVKKLADSKNRVLVILDSNHTHEHVLAELRSYAPLVSKDGFCIVCDTAIDKMPELVIDRPWGKGNNPGTAIEQYLSEVDNFEIEKFYESKSLITCAPGGFLKRTK